MLKEKKYRRTITAILLIIFAVYYTGVSFFYHCHTINGVTIVHSHFHNAKHEQGGMHSTSELTLISNLSSFDSPVASIFYFVALLGIITIVFKENYLSKKFTSKYKDGISLRAPPVF